MRILANARRRLHRRPERFAIATLVLLAGGAAAPIALAGAPTSVAGPAIRSTSLRQSGRALVWRLVLTHRISTHQLATDRRTLCLLLAERRSGGGAGALCVAAPDRRNGDLRLTWTRQSGTTRPVVGTVARIPASGFEVTVSPLALGLGWHTLRWQMRVTARSVGCPADESGTPICVTALPARPSFVALHSPQLVGCVAAGPSIRYSGPRSREIALTFDDGPWTDPPSIDFVHELARLHVPGTFFEIGDQIHSDDPTGSVERAMLTNGDMIGNHTWTHPDMLDLSPAAQTAELQQTTTAIRQATGFTPCLWRPPYGAIDPALEGLARRLGYLSVYWDIDPRDWSLPGVASIVHTVLAEAQDGGIVEMHFGGGPREETLEALPTIVADLRARGYRFVNLVQMFGLREIWR